MGDDNRESNLKNLTEELHITKSIFRNYSLQLYADSSRSNEGKENCFVRRIIEPITSLFPPEVIKQVSIMREGLKINILKLSNIVRGLLDKIDHVWGTFLPLLQTFTGANDVSWLIGVLASSITLCVTLLVLIALSCTCCHAENLTGYTLVVAMAAVSLASIPLGFFGIFEMLLGGHGEVT